MDVDGKMLIVMGPCACGKSEVGSKLSQLYSCPFIDADALHSEENILKMRSGIPLSDEDRIPWLIKVRNELILESKRNSVNPQSQPNVGNKDKVLAVTACSALKTIYRDILRGSEKDRTDTYKNIKIIFVFLDCSRNVLEQRLVQRTGHFMKAQMLDSQLQALERPSAKELSDTIIVNGDLEFQDLIREIIQKLEIKF